MGTEVMLPRLLVILDLDETLVHTTERGAFAPGDFKIDAGSVRRRPGLEAMLREVASFANVAIWSSGGNGYVADVARKIVPDDVIMQFVWARSRCTRRIDEDYWREYWVKDLKKVKDRGYALERMLIFDDTPEMVERNYGNHIRIEPFFDDPEDNALPNLARYLKNVETVENVRSVEKRGWSSKISDHSISS